LTVASLNVIIGKNLFMQNNKAILECLKAINSVVLAKPLEVKLALATLLAEGSILIEDRPGLGKTTLAKTIAKVLGLSFNRIQCTNDLLPMDILGRIEFLPDRTAKFVEGPIFASIVILDELNRAPARTQSAFLQAMEEGEVSVEGQTHKLPTPQMFIATQNPSDHIGTTLLPEAELDRFTISLSLGYPDQASERSILLGEPQKKINTLETVVSRETLMEFQVGSANIRVSELFLDLVTRFLAHIRTSGVFISPRAGRDIVRVSKSLALIDGRDHVLPEDFKSCVSAVIAHRIVDAKKAIYDFKFEA
jgi:MoxR-like ATPase